MRMSAEQILFPRPTNETRPGLNLESRFNGLRYSLGEKNQDFQTKIQTKVADELTPVIEQAPATGYRDGQRFTYALAARMADKSLSELFRLHQEKMAKRQALLIDEENRNAPKNLARETLYASADFVSAVIGKITGHKVLNPPLWFNPKPIKN